MNVLQLLHKLDTKAKADMKKPKKGTKSSQAEFKENHFKFAALHKLMGQEFETDVGKPQRLNLMQELLVGDVSKTDLKTKAKAFILFRRVRREHMSTISMRAQTLEFVANYIREHAMGDAELEAVESNQESIVSVIPSSIAGIAWLTQQSVTFSKECNSRSAKKIPITVVKAVHKMLEKRRAEIKMKVRYARTFGLGSTLTLFRSFALARQLPLRRRSTLSSLTEGTTFVCTQATRASCCRAAWKYPTFLNWWWPTSPKDLT